MKIKLLTTLTFMLFAYMSSVYAQLDSSQIEILQKLQQEEIDIDDPMDSFEDKEPLDKIDLADDQEITTETVNDFGYQGRNDFLVAPKPKFANEPLERFGYDYFEKNQNTFLPTNDTPIPPDYVLGPGDIIKIILFGNNNEKYTLQVTREGDIFIPEIGPVSIAGLTFNDVKETINQIIDNQLIGTKATLTLGNLRAVNIFVLGEALNPGMYTISALSTLTNAVFANGGIKSTGSLRNIQLKRNGVIISDFDFYDLLLKGDTSSDLRLMSGDVVFIPPTQKLVGIAGEVKRPGIYELKGNENAEDLISFAGALRAKADLSSIEIERIDTLVNSFNLMHVDLDVTPFSKIELKDGDKLSIYPVTEKLNSAILLRGHTLKPGFHPWVEGMKILDIISAKGDLLPMTDMNYVLVKRESEIGLDYEFIQVNLQKLFKDPTSQNNIALTNRDEIIFFPSMLDLNLIRTVESESTYDNNDSQLATYYAKKSITEMQNSEALTDLDPSSVEKKYFHYYVYDYCVVSENKLIELFGTETEAVDAPNLELTRYCRNQIIEPILAVIEQQSSPMIQDQIITVFGNVKFPGRYPLVNNASVKAGLASAGGLQGLTYADEIDITRKSYTGKEVLEINTTINVNEIENTILDPLDIITVKKLDYDLAVVTVLGEIYFPGDYPLAKDETFTSLVNRAGGFKDTAGIRNTFFQRKDLIENELKQFEAAQSNLRKQLLLASNDSLGSSDDNEEYLNKILMLTEQESPDPSSLGRLVIDAFGILDGTSKDIKLTDGDIIIVPKQMQTVKVIGEVYAPNTHFYEPNKKPNDYIELSGGLNEFADEKNIYVIKQNGSVMSLASSGGFFRGASNNLESGDTIVVPITVSTYSGLRATTEITQIIYQMALSAAAVNSF